MKFVTSRTADPRSKATLPAPQSQRERKSFLDTIWTVKLAGEVADYGLAKAITDTNAAHTGVMTPLYAAPEFFAGRTSPHSDQYSLAVTYCHLRTGRPPFVGTPVEIMRGHTSGAPNLSVLPVAERNVVSRALSKEPARRWPNCRAFVAALVATGPPVDELPASEERASVPPRFFGPRRRKWVIAALALLLIVAAVGLSVSVPSGRAVKTPEPTTEPNRPDLPAAPIRTLNKHQGIVSALAYSPDGRRALSAGFDSTVRLWDLESGRELLRLDGHQEAVRCVAFTPDGKRAVSAGGMNGRDFMLRLWDLNSGQLLREFPGHRHHVHALVVLPDGHRVISASLDGTVRRWNLDNGREILRYQNLAAEDLAPSGWRNQVWQMALSKDGSTLACGLRGGVVRLLDVESGQELGRLAAHRNLVSAMTVLPNGQLVTADSELFDTGVRSDNMIRVWDLAERKEVTNIPAPFAIRSMVGTCSAQHLLLGGKSVDGIILPLTGDGKTFQLTGHAQEVWSAALSPDGRTALTGDASGTIRLWNLPHNQ